MIIGNSDSESDNIAISESQRCRKLSSSYIFIIWQRPTAAISGDPRMCSSHPERLIRLVYVLCSTDGTSRDIFEEGHFQTPAPIDGTFGAIDSSPAAAAKRIKTAMLAMQAFYAKSRDASFINLSSTAESADTRSIDHQDHPRTFHMDSNGDSLPHVHLFRLSRPVEFYYSLTQETLWETISLELAMSPLMRPSPEHVKIVAFLSFTRYHHPLNDKDGDRKVPYRTQVSNCLGYASIGGPMLTLIGTPLLWTWAESEAMFIAAFQDERPLPLGCLEDSRGRRTRGGSYASGLGALAHELGHTLDLGHYSSGTMSRDCDFIDQFFLGKSQNCPPPIKWWPRSAQLILAHHRWFQCFTSAAEQSQQNPHDEPSVPQTPFSCQLIPKNQIHGDHLLIRSLNSRGGIIVIEGRTRSGLVIFERLFVAQPLPYEVIIPLLSLHVANDIHDKSEDPLAELFIMDVAGNSLRHPLQHQLTNKKCDTHLNIKTDACECNQV